MFANTQKWKQLSKIILGAKENEKPTTTKQTIHQRVWPSGAQSASLVETMQDPLGHHAEQLPYKTNSSELLHQFLSLPPSGSHKLDTDFTRHLQSQALSPTHNNFTL